MIIPHGCKDETIISDGLNTICSLIACVQDAALRLEYMKSVTKEFKTKFNIIEESVRNLRLKIKETLPKSKMQAGLFGIDSLKENIKKDSPAILTSVMQDFLDQYGEEPIVYVAGCPSSNDIQELRRVYCYFISSETGCSINADGEESDYLHTLAEMFRSGINIQITHNDSTGTFVDYYIALHASFLRDYLGDKAPLIKRCIELTSYVEESIVTIKRKDYCSALQLSKGISTKSENHLFKSVNPR